MRYVLTIVGILVIIGALVALKGAQIAKLIAFGKEAQEAGPPPEAVGTAIAEDQSWEDVVSAIGSVATARGVALSTDVAGVVTRIHFESGAVVKQGQVLVELDSAVERAQLASAIARRELAQTTVKRTRGLAASGSISQAQVDNDEAQLQTATTDAEAISAQIAKKTIRAPFSGKLGIRAVNLGQYLNPGTPVTVLETADAVHVDFTLPQQRLAEVGVGMPARIESSDEGGAPIIGKIAAVDPTIDPITRNIKLRADIDKKDDQLRPGMFVNVSVVLPKKANVVAVPNTAVIHATYGDSVFIVEDKKAEAGKPAPPAGSKVARQQFVRLGQARGDFVSIVEGVKAKQEVVVIGGFKLRNNSPVIVDNTNKPKPSLDPRPENR